jgi:hypothetical protein
MTGRRLTLPDWHAAKIPALIRLEIAIVIRKNNAITET